MEGSSLAPRPRSGRYDYIIIGSGIAGLYTALLARNYGRVLILTKGSIDECNTKYAQGGIAAAVGRSDSPRLHMRDTLLAGAGLCDEGAVRVLAEEGPDRINDLIQLGVPFDTVEGEIALAREGAHSVPRVLHAGGDATGANIELTLSSVARLSNIDILEHHLVSEILVEKDEARGVISLNCLTGECHDIEGAVTVVATGGAGQLFAFNTNPTVATGDGVSLCYRAGATITDMEFFQFHPTALCLPGAPTFLISEAVRGEGGLLLNADGYRFMPDYDSNAELAPRDIVSRAALAEMNKTGIDHVFLDVTHLPATKVISRFPSIYRFCHEHGLDITTSQIPVAPAAHYMMGGIKTNLFGETNIERLFACGEAACTGVHGANRLASNSLLETLVFGKRIIERTLGRRGSEDTEPRLTFGPSSDVKTSLPLSKETVSGRFPELSLTAVQQLMWNKVGIIRTENSLREASTTLSFWESSYRASSARESNELSNMLLLARLITEAALIREESRGAHSRSDYPKERREWQRHITFRKESTL